MTRKTGARPRRRYVIRSRRRMLGVRYGVGLLCARPGDSPFKKRLRSVNGIWISYPAGSVWLLFRHPS